MLFLNQFLKGSLKTFCLHSLYRRAVWLVHSSQIIWDVTSHARWNGYILAPGVHTVSNISFIKSKELFKDRLPFFIIFDENMWNWGHWGHWGHSHWGLIDTMKQFVYIYIYFQRTWLTYFWGTVLYMKSRYIEHTLNW